MWKLGNHHLVIKYNGKIYIYIYQRPYILEQLNSLLPFLKVFNSHRGHENDLFRLYQVHPQIVAIA